MSQFEKSVSWIALSLCLLSTTSQLFAQMTFAPTPAANATAVATNANIILDFDADVNLSTVHSNTTNPDDVFDDNIKIIGSQSGQFRGVFSLGADNSILVFNPNISFKAGERITVIVNSLVLSSGAQPATASSFSFLAQAGPFEGGYKERPTAGIPGVVYGHSDWGDYDGDGDIDVVVVGFDQAFDQIARIYNNVNGVFTDIGAGLTGVSDSGCKWGDFDGDGDLDVVIAGLDASFTTRITKIYRNDGGATFTDIGASLTGVDFASVDWGDYDNDGDLDLVVGGRYSFSPDFHSTTIYQNNAGIFTDIGAGLTGVTDGSVNWGDYDADGDLDLLVHGFDESLSRHFIVYRNDGGTFTDTGNALPGFGFSNADWGDYDNDGDLDIAILGGKSAGTDGAFIYQNNAGVFTDVNAGLPDDIEEGSIQWGDYDGDGDLDLLLTGQDYSPGDNITSAIFRNDAGLFTNIQASLEGVAFQSVGDWVDFDSDGDLDIFVAGENIPGDIIGRLYENTIFNPFITTWKTDNPGSSNDDQITIPTTGTGYFYDVNWGDGMTDTGVTGDITHTYATPGTYTVSITGAFPRIYFNAGLSFLPQKDKDKILSVDQWGDIAWTSMSNAFAGCENLRINAIDAPDLSGVTSLSRMFFNAIAMNDNINHWDVSTITNMSGLFRDAEAFNQPLSSWNVSNVTNMSELFFFARTFNQDLSTWIVDNVTNMQWMFLGATAFNGNVSSWHVDNVTNMSSMFGGAASFNQDISGWQITSATNLGGMFSSATSFNQDISTKIGGGNNGGDAWDTNGVTNMEALFRDADAFTQPIVNWDVSTVTDMREMFADHDTFNQDITGWVVDNVTDMQNMFDGATSFDQDISGWNVSAVRIFNGMFNNATAFNQPIGSWTLNAISNIDMRNMFDGASSFDQDLSSWNVTRLTQAINMFNNSGLSVANYDLLLEGWAAQSVSSGVSFGAQGIYYCSAQTARDALTNAPNNWSITDGGRRCISLFAGPDTSAPEIFNGQPQAIDFGSTSTTKARNFTILNNQGVPISVDIVNSGVGFPTTLNFPSIPAGGTQTFSISLTGPVGTYTETVDITSPNFSGPFQFDVTGEVTTAPEPEIAVFEGSTVTGTPILDGQALAFQLGIEFRGNSLTRDITITNIGDADLNISDITFTGTEFQLVSIPPTIIPVDGTEIIQVLVTGTNAGIFLETMVVSSDDTDEATFSFGVFAEIIGPDIWVVDGLDIFSDPEIINGQVTPVDFGSGASGSDIVRQLTLTNATGADLFVSNISISGSAFTFTPLAPFAVAGESDGIYDEIVFEITLSGAIGGTFNETVTITNDDNADPIFTFPITGTIIDSGCGTLPTVDAGADATVCAGTVMLAGAVGGSATGATWTLGPGATGNFDDQTILNPEYTPSAGDLAAGSISLTLTVAASGSCPQVEDQIVLNFPSAINADAPSVQGNVGQTTNVDVVAGSGTNSANVLTVTITQDPTQGIATVNTDNTISYTPNAGTVGADSFEYEICNSCGLCDLATVSVNIVNAPPVFTAPTTTPTAAPGQSIVLSIPALVSDLNDNLDLSSFSNFSSSAGATSNYDPSTGELTLDYSNAAFTSAQDNISFTICDLLSSCTDVSVQVDLDGEITVFNGISPNGDGDNDFFTIQNIQFVEPENKVSIYNRWGDLIFDVDNYNSENPDRRFNGTSNKGKEVTSGVYFYKVEFASGRESIDGYLTIKK